MKGAERFIVGGGGVLKSARKGFRDVEHRYLPLSVTGVLDPSTVNGVGPRCVWKKHLFLTL